MVKDDHFLRPRHVLEQLLDLLVILAPDLLLVHELLLGANMARELEAVHVEAELILASARVVDDNGARVVAEVVLRLPGGRSEVDVAVGCFVAGRSVVVKRGGDVVRGEDGGDGHCC